MPKLRQSPRGKIDYIGRAPISAINEEFHQLPDITHVSLEGYSGNVLDDDVARSGPELPEFINQAGEMNKKEVARVRVIKQSHRRNGLTVRTTQQKVDVVDSREAKNLFAGNGCDVAAVGDRVRVVRR